MEINYNHSGQLLPFMLDEGIARGRIVRITDSSFSKEQLQTYPAIALKYLSQLICLGASLMGDIKNSGSMTLQITGGQYISLIVAEIHQDGTFRSCARISDENLKKLEETNLSFQELFNGGQFVVTSKLEEFNEEHQAIIEIHGETLESCLQHYFVQSCQIPTIIKVISKIDPKLPTKDYISSMLFIQKLPHKENHNLNLDIDDLWNTYKIFIDTLLPEEMLNTQISDPSILYRLFNQHIVHVFPEKKLQMRCNCSQERIEQIILNLEKDIMKDEPEKKSLSVDCNFCQKKYTVDLKKLFNNIST
ncbi:MAG: hypothetical protein C0432_03710 [Candidatus Puniceispirillum sp.]|nr:hypothetical protein [Candidatus Pelagibacter sp.]MBA4283381.1 hypothetical protein [Candidatus Puniceispirillum sp.]